jgi:hypothetical protein
MDRPSLLRQDAVAGLVVPRPARQPLTNRVRHLARESRYLHTPRACQQKPQQRSRISAHKQHIEPRGMRAHARSGDEKRPPVLHGRPSTSGSAAAGAAARVPAP